MDTEKSPDLYDCAGGIVGNYAYSIDDCYNKGPVITNHYYRGSICGGFNGATSSGSITNCYSTDTIAENMLVGRSYGTISNSYNVVEGSNATKLTLEQMRLQESFIGFDFDSVWGIDPNINEGFPYLKWAYEDMPKIMDYTINSLAVTNSSGDTLEEVPTNEDFYIDISLKKNSSKNNKDYIIIAMYDSSDRFLDFTQIGFGLEYNQNFTLSISQKNKDVSKIKAFVWDELSTMIPLSNVCTFE